MNNRSSNNYLQGFSKIKKLYISIMLLYELADKLFGSIYIAFMRSKGLTLIQISRLFSIEQILLAIFDYPTGAISDKMGRKKVAAYGFIIWGLGILQFAFSTNFWLFLPAMVLMALGLALISGAPSAWLIDQMIAYGVYEKRDQIFPRIQASVRFFSIIALISSYIFIGIAERLPIIIAGCTAIIAGITALIIGEDNYGEVNGNNIFNIMHIYLKDFVKEKKLVVLALRNIICYTSFIAFVLYWQIYATEIIEIKNKYLAVFLIAFMILLMMGNFSVSILTKRINSFMTSILGIVISILGFGLLLTFQSLTIFIVAAGLVEFGFGVEQASTSTWVCDYIKSETRATYSSIFSTIQAVGGFLITNFLGLLTEATAVNTAWIVAIVAMISDILILVVFYYKYRNKRTL